MTSVVPLAVSTTDVEVGAVDMVVMTTTVDHLLATMIVIAAPMVAVGAMTTLLVALIATLLLVAMIVTQAIAETTVVVVAEETAIMVVEMVDALVAMASQLLPGNLASRTEVDTMIILPMIGIPVDECGQLIRSGAERPAK